MTETEKKFELGKPYSRLEIVGPNDIIYTSVEGRTIKETHKALMDRLSDLTMERGMQVPDGLLIQGEIGRKIGIFRFGVRQLERRPLIP